MTVLVGIKASDGVVIAADGAATYATAQGSPSIKQPTKKLELVDNKVAFAGSGAVGMSQQFKEATKQFANLASNKSVKQLFKSNAQFHKFTADSIKPLVVRAFSQSNELSRLGNLTMEVSVTSLWMFPTESGPALAQMSPTCNAEFASDNLPFFTAGSGQTAADPFLAFLRKYVWAENLPSLEQAVLFAIWAVRHTIDVQAGFVSEPFQVMTLTQRHGSNDFTFNEKSKEDIESHLEMVESINAEIKSACTKALSKDTDQQVPKLNA